MQCPNCGKLKSRVIDSRSFRNGTRRRRQCSICGSRFTTYERIQPYGIFVIKKDGRREQFSRDKLATGIRKACEKRPLPTGAIDKLIDSIENSVFHQGKHEVLSSYLGDLVMKNLRKLDHVAYIRFASVYHEFADIGVLKHEIDTLVDHSPAKSTNQLPLLPLEEKKPPQNPE